MISLRVGEYQNLKEFVLEIGQKLKAGCFFGFSRRALVVLAVAQILGGYPEPS